MIETRLEITEWLIKNNIFDYRINNDLSVDVNETIDLSDKGLKELPIQFGVVNNFYCAGNNLTSLKGCPIEIIGHFSFMNNEIENLYYFPQKVNGTVWASGNKLLGDLQNKDKFEDFIHVHIKTKLTTDSHNNLHKYLTDNNADKSNKTLKI